jgi:hypothetical protein
MRASYSTHVVNLGDCDCPGNPHPHDEANVKDRFTFGDLRRIAYAMGDDGGLVQSVTVAQGVDSWNLVRQARNGLGIVTGVEPLPVSVESVDELAPEQARKLTEEFSKPEYDRQLRASLGLPPKDEEVAPDGSVPPASGEPSLAGIEEPNSSNSETSNPAP